MKILLTNDDGIYSPGIKILFEILSKFHDVWMVAPLENMSGTSHSLTLSGPVMISKRGDQIFGARGTPADCVLFSILGAIPVKPDIIISGLNLGPNLGTDIIYSGTAAAARQASLMGFPAIASSLFSSFASPEDIEFASHFIVENLDTFLRLWHPDHFVNINFPLKNASTGEAIITHISRRKYSDTLESYPLYEHEIYYFLKGAPIQTELEEGSDWKAVQEGKVSITPVYLHPVKHEVDKRYQDVRFKQGKP